MKQNGLKTSFGRVDEKAPGARTTFSLPTDAQDYEYPYKIQVNLPVHNTGCFKKSFKTLKAYKNLYRGHKQRFELSKYSKRHRDLPG
jgi:hypothetical protein